jgi:hypothetical protein
MRHLPQVLPEPFGRRLYLPFPSSDLSAAGPLCAAAGALNRPLGNR